MSLPFDENQVRAITAERNAVVTAGAGSGKTAVLAERYLWLVADRGAQVEQILALTFTQKAAAEMYQRIYERLSEAGSKLRPALESFDRSQISTLDSFCAEIARGSCSRYGLTPDFRCDEEAVGSLAANESLDFLLENLKRQEVRELIRILGFERLWRELLADLAFRHYHFAPQWDFQAMLESQLERCRRDLDRELLALEERSDRLMRIAPRGRTLQANRDSVASLAPLGELVRDEAYGEALGRLAGLSLRKVGGSRAVDLVEMNGLVEDIRPLAETLGVLLHTLGQAPLLREIALLLQGFQERFVEAKRLQGLATFQDVAELAVDVALRDKAVRQHYKRRFRHILIDEFQDNNRLQRDLLFLLAERLPLSGDRVPEAAELEEGKLFFVGDEKQSIYRFRGADVSVFTSLHRELEQAGGSALVLDRNYRSEPGLVSFFNRLFARVLAGGGEAQPPKPFEARFQEMAAGVKSDGLIARVHVLVKPPPEQSAAEPAGNREAEALAVARLIQGCVEEGSLSVGEPGERRPADYDDFAVLLRSTGNQIHFERTFRSLGIPYASHNLRSLFLEAPINDFYLALQLAVYPEDRHAFAGFLRTPFVNVSDDTLVRLLLDGPPGSDPFSGLGLENGAATDPTRGSRIAGDPVVGHPTVSDPVELEKLRRGRAVYLFLRDEADRLPLAELIHRLWYGFGYRYLILSDPRYHPYLEFYEHLLQLAEASDRRGEPLVRFLDFLRENLGRYERLEELEASSSRGEGVQLLTIHKSKGLQFPVVVLADMGNSGRSGGSSQAYFRSDDFGIAVNLGQDSYFARLGSRQADELELAEIRRLLYVACTRAESHLILSGSTGRRQARTPRAHLTMVLEALGLPELLDPGVFTEEREGYRLEVQRIPDLPRSRWLAAGTSTPALRLDSVAPLYDREPVRRPAPRREISVTELCSRLMESAASSGPVPGSRPAAELPALPSLEEQLPPLPVDPHLSAGRLEPGFGTLTHEILAAVLREPDLPPPEPDWARLHIPEALRSVCLESARSLVSGFLGSELGSKVRGAARVETELPFVYRWEHGGTWLNVSGQIDAVLDAAGELTLIDFKTDRVYRAGEYACQLGLYALALGEMTGREVHATLFLLRGARAVALSRRFDWPRLFAALRL